MSNDGRYVRRARRVRRLVRVLMILASLALTRFLWTDPQIAAELERGLDAVVAMAKSDRAATENALPPKVGAERLPSSRVRVNRPAPPLESATTSQIIRARVKAVGGTDTLVVQGSYIKLRDLDCPEPGSPDGGRAARYLRDLTVNMPVVCSVAGTGSPERKIGDCALPDGRDVADVMVIMGMCRR